jgi:hypothetical protein
MVYHGCYGTCLRHIFGTWLRHILVMLGICYEMLFLVILAYGLCEWICFDDDDVSCMVYVNGLSIDDDDYQ